MAGRKSIQSVLTSKFGVDYFDTLKELNSKKMEICEIKEYFYNKYSLNITDSTIKAHLRKISNNRNGRKSILEHLEDKGIVDFDVFFKSIANKSIDEIKEVFFKEYQIKVSEGTINFYFKKYGIEFNGNKNSSKVQNNIEYIKTNLSLTNNNNQLFVDKKMPLIRWFNPRNGFPYIYIEKYPKYLVEVKAFLEILSTEEGYIKSFLVIHNGKENEKSDILYNRKLNCDEIKILNDFNFQPFCINKMINYVESIKDNLDIYE